MKKLYSIYMEGHRASGSSDTASYCGSVTAESFQEACMIIFKDDDDFDPENLDVWGCRLYDNLTDAQKVFG